jgi:hypothetical protein
MKHEGSVKVEGRVLRDSSHQKLCTGFVRSYVKLSIPSCLDAFMRIINLRQIQCYSLSVLLRP